MYSWGTLNQDIAIWSGKAEVDVPGDPNALNDQAGDPHGEHQSKTPLGSQPPRVFWDRTFAAGTRHTVEFVCECSLGANFYEVQAAVSQEHDRHYNDQRMLHWKDEAAFFQVLVNKHEYFFGGVCDLRMTAIARD